MLYAARFNPECDQMISRAARGELSALRDLREYMLACGQTGLVTPSEAVQQTEIVARMAASHGEYEDRVALLGVLLKVLQAQIDQNEGVYDDDTAAEIAAMADELMHGGGPEIDAMLDSILASSPPEILSLASTLRKEMDASLAEPSAAVAETRPEEN